MVRALGGQHLHRVRQLLQACLNPGQLGAGIPEALEVPVEGFPGGQHRTLQIGDAIRKCRTGGRNRGGQTKIRTATATFGADPAALVDAAFFRHGVVNATSAPHETSAARRLYPRFRGLPSGEFRVNGD
jgi:hypothetical protein